MLEVAGSAGLSMVAFTTSGIPFTPKPDDRLQVQWPLVPGNSPVRLRAVSLRRHVYYRMDAERPARTDRFEWPMDVLVKLNLRGAELGVVAWIQQIVAEKPVDVYVPLQLGTSLGPVSTGSYIVQLVPGTDLSEVFVTLAAVGLDGRDEKHLKRDEPLKYGFYPAERPILVRLSGLPVSGLYRLRLGAVLKNGGSANKDFVFFHPGT
jgi:hypothetical protein